MGAEGGLGEPRHQRLGKRRIGRRKRDGGRQSLRDLMGEGGSGQHRNRRLRLRFGRDLGQQFHAARFYALRAENEGPVSLRKTAEQGLQLLGGRDGGGERGWGG